MIRKNAASKFATLLQAASIAVVASVAWSNAVMPAQAQIIKTKIPKDRALDWAHNFDWIQQGQWHDYVLTRDYGKGRGKGLITQAMVEEAEALASKGLSTPEKPRIVQFLRLKFHVKGNDIRTADDPKFDQWSVAFVDAANQSKNTAFRSPSDGLANYAEVKNVKVARGDDQLLLRYIHEARLKAEGRWNAREQSNLEELAKAQAEELGIDYVPQTQAPYAAVVAATPENTGMENAAPLSGPLPLPRSRVDALKKGNLSVIEAPKAAGLPAEPFIGKAVHPRWLDISTQAAGRPGLQAFADKRVVPNVALTDAFQQFTALKNEQAEKTLGISQKDIKFSDRFEFQPGIFK